MNFDKVRPLELISRGVELMNKQDYENAIKAFDEGLKHIQGSLIAHICRAFCKLELLAKNPNIEEYERFKQEIEVDLRSALSTLLGLPRS